MSESVARLRRQGMAQTVPDPADGRRTLVRLTAGHPDRVADAAATPVDEALAGALGDAGPAVLAEVTVALSVLARHLRPREPGPMLGYLTAGGGEPGDTARGTNGKT